MNFIAAAFSEVNGSPSSTRLLSGLVIICWLAVYLKAGWTASALPAVTPEQVGVLLVAFGAKVWQKRSEKEKATGNTDFIAKPYSSQS